MAALGERTQAIAHKTVQHLYLFDGDLGAQDALDTEIAALSVSVEDMSARVVEIAASVQQISAETARMQSDIANVAGVAESSSASAEQVSATTQETSASAQEIAASSQDLARTAEALERLVGQFRYELPHRPFRARPPRPGAMGLRRAAAGAPDRPARGCRPGGAGTGRDRPQRSGPGRAPPRRAAPRPRTSPSSGPPVETFAEASPSGRERIAVALTSWRVGRRTASQRPGMTCSENARSASQLLLVGP